MSRHDLTDDDVKRGPDLQLLGNLVRYIRAYRGLMVRLAAVMLLFALAELLLFF